MGNLASITLLVSLICKLSQQQWSKFKLNFTSFLTHFTLSIIPFFYASHKAAHGLSNATQMLVNSF